MSLLLNTSLVVTPTVYNQGTLFGIVPTDPSSNNADFTVTRATTKTRTNSIGLIETVAINAPSIDYSLGSCPNILLEPQRTNLAVSSSQFDGAAWIKSATSVTADSTTSPSGVVDADTLTGDGTNSSHNLRQSNSVTIAVSYTFSCYVKKNTNDFIQLFYNSGFGFSAFANFDLNSGVLGTIGTGTTASITSVGNGWHRCSITAVATSNITANIPTLCLINSLTAPMSQTNTLTTSVFLWGAQFEQGAYATSYIPTTTATVTRNTDSILRNNIFTNGLITSAGGTWFVELRNNIDRIGDLPSRIGIGDTNVLFTNCLCLIPPGILGRINIVKIIAGVSITLFVTTTDTCKIAIKWNGSTADVFENGVKVVAATSFTTTNMQFLCNSGLGAPININEMALFPTPLSDTECIALTTL